jgi:branched-chain amino acid transport system permease protein
VIVVWAIVGVSLVVLTGWAGQISLGQFALVAIGAAVTGSLVREGGVDPLAALAAGTAAGLVAAVVLGLPALRIRGLFLAVTTLAFAATTSSYLLHVDWLVPEGVIERPFLFGRIDLESDRAFYFFTLALLVLAIVAVRRLRQSRVGRAIVAVRDNERAAQAYGANATVAKLTAFAVSGAIAGLAGGLLVLHQHRLIAVQYDPSQSLQAFAMAVIGGLGSIPGAVIGAIYVKGAQSLLTGGWSLLGTGIGVIVVLLLLPHGLGSLVFRGRDTLLRFAAQRRDIVVPSLLADRIEASREHEEADHANSLDRAAHEIGVGAGAAG